MPGCSTHNPQIKNKLINELKKIKKTNTNNNNNNIFCRHDDIQRLV
jgi:hypothetical protein